MPRLGRLARALFPMRSQSELSSKSSVASRRAASSAFLDGLRGVAAFVVLMHHISKDPFPWLPWGYGSKRHDVTQYYLLQLPVVRVIHSGPSMVAVFFVVSGFALAVSPLKQIRRRDQAGLAHGLASSVFRRVIRLYLPCVVTTLFMLVAVRLHMAPFPANRPRSSSLVGEVGEWVYSAWRLLNPFDLSFTLPRYDDNLWTIPAELRGSMVLYVTLLAVARLRRGARLAVESLVTAWLLSYGLWDVSLFTAGLVLAEIHLEREAARPAGLPLAQAARPAAPAHSRRSRTLVMVAFVVSLHLVSAPLNGYGTALGYSWLSALAPPVWVKREVAGRWIPTLGAPLLVFCVDRSTRLRRLFASGPAAYLGRISFGLYLVHGPVRYTAYHPLLRNAMGAAGLEVRAPDKDIEEKHGWLKAVTWIKDLSKDKDKAHKQAEERADTATLDWRFIVAVAVTWAIVVPGTVALADLFARTVDEPTVHLAKRVEARYTDPQMPGRRSDEGEREKDGASAPHEWADVDRDRAKAH